MHYSGDTVVHPSREQIDQFVSGHSLADEVNQLVESHLENCSACQDMASSATSSQFEKRLSSVASFGASSIAKLSEGYDVESEIGRGGAGIVYKARHKSLGKTVALKMLLLGVDSTPRALARFRREARALAQLSHPNIDAVFDSGEQQGVPFVAMEFIEGPTLAKALLDHLLPLSRLNQ